MAGTAVWPGVLTEGAKSADVLAEAPPCEFGFGVCGNGGRVVLGEPGAGGARSGGVDVDAVPEAVGMGGAGRAIWWVVRTGEVALTWVADLVSYAPLAMSERDCLERRLLVGPAGCTAAAGAALRCVFALCDEEALLASSWLKLSRWRVRYLRSRQ